MSSTPITVCLSPKIDSLWKSCFNLENEMIVTCQTRRIFPTLEYTVTGLSPSKSYSMCLHIELVDDKKLRYNNGSWTESFSTEKKDPPRKVFHHHGAQIGQEWMNKGVNFDRVRITNRKSKEDGEPSNIHLLTSHRYIPVLTIYEGADLVHTACIPHTKFITVTAYHNGALNSLKIENNPYATGCRPDRRRTREQPDESGSSSKRQKTSEAPIVPSSILQSIIQQLLIQQNLPPTPSAPSAEVVKEEPIEIKPEVVETPLTPPTTPPALFNPMMIPNFQMFPTFYPFGFNPFLNPFASPLTSLFPTPPVTPGTDDVKTSDDIKIEVVE